MFGYTGGVADENKTEFTQSTCLVAAINSTIREHMCTKMTTCLRWSCSAVLQV